MFRYSERRWYSSILFYSKMYDESEYKVLCQISFDLNFIWIWNPERRFFFRPIRLNLYNAAKNEPEIIQHILSKKNKKNWNLWINNDKNKISRTDSSTLLFFLFSRFKTNFWWWRFVWYCILNNLMHIFSQST